ncbi:Cellobiohydrolase I [Mycena indigotica]|uniref:Cellobiohydrolase I n=1 Tax=Mycena indigotica TaxID=2126181 RepID=A0A8H6SE04_9AGAR|nr:Cellobiohydrolase I [Mycena indigotica]KAF7297030.1 Cellobiohydrolase I [Mycena indigotica]
MSTEPLPGPHQDIEYLSLPRFNRSLDFDFTVNEETYNATVSYALTYAPDETTWPVLVFFNGLGGHRLIAALIEGIVREHGVQVLTIDKHGAGESKVVNLPKNTPFPLEARTRFMHTGLLAVLARHNITQFAVLSHSNGLYYALYSLLNLPPSITPLSWTLTGPFVPPSISGSASLRFASMLPAALPNSLGTILQAAPALGAAVNWSGGILSTSAGLFSGANKYDEESDTKGFLDRHIGPSLRSEAMRRGLAESKISMGQEAVFSLHGGEPAADSDSANCIWGIGPGSTDGDILKGAFERIAERYLHPSCPPGIQLSVNVVYGAADGMVPKQGRNWLRELLETTGLIGEGDKRAWIEIPDAGHDDILFLEEVVGCILRRVIG